MSAPRRFVFVDHAGVLGGAELSLLDLATALGSRARVALLADGPFADRLRARGVRVTTTSMGALAEVRKDTRLPSLGAVAAAWRAAGALGVTVDPSELLCANSQKAFVVSALAGWRAGRPVAWMLRDILAPPHFSRANIRAVITLANWRACCVVANSQATADAFVAAGGRRSLVRVVHNGIDAAPFDAVTEADGRAVRLALHIPDDAFTVAMPGRFHAWKGQHVLLDALAQLPSVHAIIAGAPLFGEHAFADELRARAARLGVMDRVHFTGFRDDVPALLTAADVVVHASTLPEPFGRVVVEGMLAHRPVVASNAGGVPELIVDGESGVLVPPGDAAALAAAIAALRDDAPRAARIAAAGARRARTLFTVGAMARGIEEALAAC
ncbi:MAG: glycosyltransferase [Gemmatimonadetes bacterium]|nr:glycosyltransferase [Gemmatimonadota bacterium]